MGFIIRTIIYVCMQSLFSTLLQVTQNKLTAGVYSGGSSGSMIAGSLTFFGGLALAFSFFFSLSFAFTADLEGGGGSRTGCSTNNESMR